MPFGLLAGLAAALSWGTMDIAGALVSRRIGSLRVMAGVQLVGAVLFVLLAIVTATRIPSDPRVIAISAFLGIIGAGAYLSYFKALQVGPIAVVSGMVAAYGGLTVGLAVVFRGETLTGVQALGAAVATIGVIMTGVAFGGGLRATRFAGPGVVFAVVALVLFAAMAITTDIAIESATWLQVLLVARLVNGVISIVTIVALVVMARRAAGRVSGHVAGRVGEAGVSREPIRRAPVLIALVAAGTLDVVGLAAFAIGLSSAPTWMVGLASSVGPVVTILFAVVFMGERLKPVQWFGLIGIAIGMIAIALP